MNDHHMHKHESCGLKALGRPPIRITPAGAEKSSGFLEQKLGREDDKCLQQMSPHRIVIHGVWRDGEPPRRGIILKGWNGGRDDGVNVSSGLEVAKCITGFSKEEKNLSLQKIEF
ncbi:hypothetical protein TNCV_4776241 [Trichonephila clavipes]|nr:hypothetical protein TNCV_4776241 [Trichonephila clavipes]